MAARFSMGDSASEGQDRTERVERISFAEDGMAVELVPLEAIRDAEASVKARYGDGGVSDVLADGMAGSREEDDLRLASLQETIAARMRKRGMASVQAERIVLTNGLEHSLELVVRMLTKPGDPVMVECPSGSLGLSVLARLGLQAIAVESDEQGIRMEALRRLLAGDAVKPKLLYAAPTYGDPTGHVWSLKRRREVLVLCREHGVRVVEDDSCGELKLHAHSPDVPTLYALAGEAGGVLYASSFESMIAPSLRVGWIAVDEELVGKLAADDRLGKEDEAHTPSAPVIDQLVLAELLLDFDLDAHVQRLADTYRERMYMLQRQLQVHQAAGAKLTWSEPEGGRFIWLTLPDGLDAEALRRITLMMGVDFAPGSRYYAGEPKRNTLRLCFTGCSVGQINQGIDIIAEAIGDFTGRWRD
ncbi:PLP-dependent aminotransferase family protein [Paenibacillus sp. CCS19]|uniref:aminotransferase-like domain-containing protein n=1 Tax=Paenibacillus sp. CCS19 TaxID=3158387 RepID=UPI00295EBEAF|nr:PLP-dependent aminotransferase family protein [Paenibacillus cellulosilyticus]